jgi:hypothetical protein
MFHASAIDNGTLDTPVLWRCGTAKEFANCLGRNETVRALHLWHSGRRFSISEVVTILKVLADNTVLETLILAIRHEVSVQQCSSLSSALGAMKNVKKLELKSLVRAPHQLAALLRGIALNNCLEELRFYCPTGLLAFKWERMPGACADEMEELENALETTNTSFHTLHSEAFCETFLSRRAVFYMKLNRIGRKELLVHSHDVKLWLERCILHRDDPSVTSWLVKNNPAALEHFVVKPGRQGSQNVSLQNNDSL